MNSERGQPQKNNIISKIIKNQKFNKKISPIKKLGPSFYYKNISEAPRKHEEQTQNNMITNKENFKSLKEQLINANALRQSNSCKISNGSRSRHKRPRLFSQSKKLKKIDITKVQEKPKQPIQDSDRKFREARAAQRMRISRSNGSRGSDQGSTSRGHHYPQKSKGNISGRARDCSDDKNLLQANRRLTSSPHNSSHTQVISHRSLAGFEIPGASLQCRYLNKEHRISNLTKYNIQAVDQNLEQARLRTSAHLPSTRFEFGSKHVKNSKMTKNGVYMPKSSKGHGNNLQSTNSLQRGELSSTATVSEAQKSQIDRRTARMAQGIGGSAESNRGRQSTEITQNRDSTYIPHAADASSSHHRKQSSKVLKNSTEGTIGDRSLSFLVSGIVNAGFNPKDSRNLKREHSEGSREQTSKTAQSPKSVHIDILNGKHGSPSKQNEIEVNAKLVGEYKALKELKKRHRLEIENLMRVDQAKERRAAFLIQKVNETAVKLQESEKENQNLQVTNKRLEIKINDLTTELDDVKTRMNEQAEKLVDLANQLKNSKNELFEERQKKESNIGRSWRSEKKFYQREIRMLQDEIKLLMTNADRAQVTHQAQTEVNKHQLPVIEDQGIQQESAHLQGAILEADGFNMRTPTKEGQEDAAVPKLRTSEDKSTSTPLLGGVMGTIYERTSRSESPSLIKVNQKINTLNLKIQQQNLKINDYEKSLRQYEFMEKHGSQVNAFENKKHTNERPVKPSQKTKSFKFRDVVFESKSILNESESELEKQEMAGLLRDQKRKIKKLKKKNKKMKAELKSLKNENKKMSRATSPNLVLSQAPQSPINVIQAHLLSLKGGEADSRVIRIEEFVQKQKELENAKMVFRDLQGKVLMLVQENERLNRELELCGSVSRGKTIDSTINRQ